MSNVIIIPTLLSCAEQPAELYAGDDGLTCDAGLVQGGIG